MDPVAALLPPDLRAVLLEVAVGTIRSCLEGKRRLPDPAEFPPLLQEPGASFVSLHRSGELRGCIGSLEAVRPLVADVANSAYLAATSDPRMSPVAVDEFPVLDIKVSVISPMLPLEVEGFADLQRLVRPGVDGLLIECGRRRGTFLPAVWEQLPEVDEFITHLWRKAGMRSGIWLPGTQVYRYTSEEFGDPGPRPPVAVRPS